LSDMSDADHVTWSALLAQTTEQLGDANEARWLCEHASGLDGAEFAAGLGEFATTAMVKSLEEMVRRRLAGEPLQYVMRRWAFRHLDVFIDERVLIPRPETEVLVDIALELVRGVEAPRIVDLGTGSGVIGLSLAGELYPKVGEVWLVDASAAALEVARANIAGIGRAGAVVRVAQGDWFAALHEELRGHVDMVVANPPYIAEGDDEVEESVVRWEPSSALFSGADGLDAIRRIVADAPAWLRSGGWLVMEMGYRQGDAVRALFDSSWSSVAVKRDLAGRDRFVVAQYLTK
jgi:release factor glutamine methyltransferase